MIFLGWLLIVIQDYNYIPATPPSHTPAASPASDTVSPVDVGAKPNTHIYFQSDDESTNVMNGNSWLFDLFS